MAPHMEVVVTGWIVLIGVVFCVLLVSLLVWRVIIFLEKKSYCMSRLVLDLDRKHAYFRVEVKNPTVKETVRDRS